MSTFSASVKTPRRTAVLALVALSSLKMEEVVLAMTRATVVLPVPLEEKQRLDRKRGRKRSAYGGPQNMHDPSESASIKLLNSAPFPRRCSCPMRSSRKRGLTRSGSGLAASRWEVVVEERADGSRGFFDAEVEVKAAGEEVEDGVSAVVFRFLPFGLASSSPSLSSLLTTGVPSARDGRAEVEVEDEGGPVQKSTWC
jgi:hypothetical protein